MLTPAKLETYMRRAAALTYETVELPPFVAFFHPHDPLRFFNYARPLTPAFGKLQQPLAALSAAFHARERLPRFEFIEESAPELAPALRAAGFEEEGRQVLMVCTPQSIQPAPVVPGLEVASLTAESALAELRTAATVQHRGFGDADAEEVAECATARMLTEATRQRERLAAGAGIFLARLDGEPVAAGAFTVPLEGLTELVGITTLPAYRRRGVATALTARTTQVAFERGVETAFLVAEDARAGHVYERVGFRPFATALAYCEAEP